MKPDLKWWQLALVSLAVSAIGGLASRKPKGDERKVYTRELKQAPWAPPPWVFGPAWTVNNYFMLSGLQRLLRSENPDKKKLLALQLPIWAIFFSFGYVYFNKKSPVLAAAWTLADTALAAASFAIASRGDKQLSHHYLPLVGWTSYASSLALYQAVKNDDPVLETEALA